MRSKKRSVIKTRRRNVMIAGILGKQIAGLAVRWTTI